VKLFLKSNIRFYFHHDEEAFFRWIKKLQFIDACEYLDGKVTLTVRSRILNRDELWDLIALFRRYKLEMPLLAQFLTKFNQKWFYDKKNMCWHKHIFGD